MRCSATKVIEAYLGTSKAEAVYGLVDFPRRPTHCPNLWRNAAADPGGAGMREKTRGVWQTHTWADYRDHVRDFAHGPSLRWASSAATSSRSWATTGPALFRPGLAQALGGVSVPVYQDSIASEVGLRAQPRGNPVIVAEDQSRLTRPVAAKKRPLPRLRSIVFDDPRGMWAYDDPILCSFESVMEAGRAFGKANRILRQGSRQGCGWRYGDDRLHIRHDRRPKGAMLSHCNMIATAEAFVEVNEIKAGDDWLSHLPMAWVGDAPSRSVWRWSRRPRRTVPEIQRPCSATCASWPDAVLAAAAHLGKHADHDAGEDRRRLAAQTPYLRVFFVH